MKGTVTVFVVRAIEIKEAIRTSGDGKAENAMAHRRLFVGGMLGKGGGVLV